MADGGDARARDRRRRPAWWIDGAAELVAAAPTVVGLDRAWIGRPGAIWSGRPSRRRATSGTAPSLTELLAGERRHRHPSRGPDARRACPRGPRRDVPRQRRGDVERPRGVSARRGVDGIVVASSDKAYGDRPAGHIARTWRSDRTIPMTSSKAVTDLLGPVVCGHATACRSPSPGAATSTAAATSTGAGSSRAPSARSCGRVAGDPLRRDVRSRLPVRPGRGLGVLVLADAVGRRPDLRGEAFNFAAGQRLSALEMVDRILRVMRSPLQPTILGHRAERGPGAACLRLARPAASSAGVRRSRSPRGLPRPSPGIATHLGETAA